MTCLQPQINSCFTAYDLATSQYDTLRTSSPIIHCDLFAKHTDGRTAEEVQRPLLNVPIKYYWKETKSSFFPELLVLLRKALISIL
ncbi:hypothetical protein AAFF_G00235070 [Aldrovandia affinis]|uniref:Uncharacterized protein n=1 Tax=Aldrovandia affinis TaxID=143900 RepID=A0AAD7SUZ4_9TELE|nr:hypothetical protein AAFF_G00235070 [Aldrovandia affinis]